MLTRFRPVLRSRHPSHQILSRHNEEKVLPLFPFKSIIRLGSTTEISEVAMEGRIEVNTTEAIKNSSNKLKMKTAFTELGVKTADWYKYAGLYDGAHSFIKNFDNEEEPILSNELPFPIIAKEHYGSRGNGNTKLDNLEELEAYIEANDIRRVLFEKFYNFSREYRLHVTEEGCFYTCRKMLKNDTPDDQKWFRNDKHCVWIMEENEAFDIPSNWEDVVHHSVLALKAVGLDIGAVDLKIQSATKKDGVTPRENPEFIVVEINSAPSFGEETTKKYIEELPKIITRKFNNI